ncbi:MAG: NAD(P)/FAD-dependent oxidoreductase [Gammaproteobacteria bacterium]
MTAQALALPTQQTDVAIIGGGLAGLTMAIQLKQLDPDFDVVVLERRRHPVPISAHKVGESTVEIGAHYLADRLGQRPYLETQQLSKFGLRFFFGSPDGDLSKADEFGASHVLPVHSFQIDRGQFENHLAKAAAELGVEFRDHTVVNGVDVADAAHHLNYLSDEGRGKIRSHWLVDAASRKSPIKKSRSLARDNNHDCYAVWFRVEETIDVDDWSSDAEWQERCGHRKRRFSTNHLMGQGYWIWIIPLASGATSIGIVASPEHHDWKALRNHDATMHWLGKHQPRCAEALAGAKPMDFHFMRRYSHDCEQVFSAQRWGLTGEAGVFLDPYYSPGTDFIAIGNCLLSDLIVRERRGEDIRARNAIYQQLYFSFCRNTLDLVVGQYGGFGDRHLMSLKTVWDFAYYWGVLALLYTNDALTDLEFMRDAESELLTVQKTGRHMQSLFRARAAKALVLPHDGRFVDQAAIPVVSRLNGELRDSLRGEALRVRLITNIALLQDVARLVEDLLVNGTDGSVGSREREILGNLRQDLA